MEAPVSLCDRNERKQGGKSFLLCGPEVLSVCIDISLQRRVVLLWQDVAPLWLFSFKQLENYIPTTLLVLSVALPNYTCLKISFHSCSSETTLICKHTNMIILSFVCFNFKLNMAGQCLQQCSGVSCRYDGWTRWLGRGKRKLPVCSHRHNVITDECAVASVAITAQLECSLTSRTITSALPDWASSHQASHWGVMLAY